MTEAECISILEDVFDAYVWNMQMESDERWMFRIETAPQRFLSISKQYLEEDFRSGRLTPQEFRAYAVSLPEADYVEGPSGFLHFYRPPNS